MWLSIIFSGIIIVAFILAGCSNSGMPSKQTTRPALTTISGVLTPVDSPVMPSRGFFMGLLPTPAQNESFEDAYRRASDFADFVPVWGRPTPFYNLAGELAGDWGRTFVDQYIRANGMFPVVHMSFIGPNLTLVSPPEITNATLQSQEWRHTFKQAALDIVRASRPLYLSLGNEVNRWYEKYGAEEGDPNGFQNYVSLYNETYDAVKQLSPQTNVYCTFAREIVSGNREADLAVLKMFDPDKLDMLVFTSYPYAVKGIKRPADIPSDYYAKALQYMPGKPFGLTEAGWSALEAFGGEQAQADFITETAGRLTTGQGINLLFLGYPWLSALDDNDSIALVRRDGTERLASTAWRKIFSGK
ncbi:MAG: hypothetical protein NUV31_01720 [Dehalococcoidales bacterium]|nr:hypothetical protein [Dehalococcoidales bacterium]